MKTIIVSNEYYSIIDLTLEYKNWTGQEKYAVISSLEQGYIETTFTKELKDYKPFIFMNESCMDIFNEYERNNEKEVNDELKRKENKASSNYYI